MASVGTKRVHYVDALYLTSASRTAISRPWWRRRPRRGREQSHAGSNARRQGQKQGNPAGRDGKMQVAEWTASPANRVTEWEEKKRDCGWNLKEPKGEATLDPSRLLRAGESLLGRGEPCRLLRPLVDVRFEATSGSNSGSGRSSPEQWSREWSSGSVDRGKSAPQVPGVRPAWLNNEAGYSVLCTQYTQVQSSEYSITQATRTRTECKPSFHQAGSSSPVAESPARRLLHCPELRRHACERRPWTLHAHMPYEGTESRFRGAIGQQGPGAPRALLLCPIPSSLAASSPQRWAPGFRQTTGDFVQHSADPQPQCRLSKYVHY